MDEENKECSEGSECDKSIKDVENALRDMMNWVAVFAGEYNVAKEAVDKLNEKIQEIAQLAGNIKCE